VQAEEVNPKTPPDQIEKIKELRKKGMSLRQIGRELRIHPSTVQTYCVADLPISEQLVEETPELSREELIERLRMIALSDPTKVITRNFFRVHSGIPERSWRHIFGTFEEFKRQARVIISRGARKLEMDISKHASADGYREVAKEAAKWGEKYSRPSSRDQQVILVAGDFHDLDVDKFALKVFLDTAKRVQPEIVVLAGDVYSLPEFGKYAVDPRDWNPAGRMEFVRDQILRPLRGACPDAQIDTHCANHEARLLKHFADKDPAFKAVLADFMEFTMAKIFGLEELEINFVSKGDLAAWTKKDLSTEVKRNFKVYLDSFLVTHETADGLKKQTPGCSGHSHKHMSWSFENPTFGAYEWHQLGCMCVRDASYTDGERWNQGFAMAHVSVKKKRVVTEYIPIGDTMACVGGKYYYR
jgi:hypothetical protein